LLTFGSFLKNWLVRKGHQRLPAKTMKNALKKEEK